MAWQLVYTSAPRLLDAGRSGFGTVARHRDIPSMLVQSVERVSQFARLPGMNPDRVIYSHRIIQISSSRYHVLSMIRSAGSDYTGRTNHIAHHLIASDREAAECAAIGLTPADVLCSYPWLSRWTEEAPRSLGAAEEVRLASVPAFALQYSVWDPLTENPAHAWLLVTHPSSRSCYVKAPTDTDFRLLFLESLRGFHSSSWQPTFITSLEPTDDASDFRWIGLDANSPSLATAESSGRPILDLTRPDTLPEPEIPQQSVPPPNVAVAPQVQPRRASPLPSVARMDAPFVEKDFESSFHEESSHTHPLHLRLKHKTDQGPRRTAEFSADSDVDAGDDGKPSTGSRSVVFAALAIIGAAMVLFGFWHQRNPSSPSSEKIVANEERSPAQQMKEHKKELIKGLLGKDSFFSTDFINDLSDSNLDDTQIQSYCKYLNLLVNSYRQFKWNPLPKTVLPDDPAQVPQVKKLKAHIKKLTDISDRPLLLENDGTYAPELDGLFAYIAQQIDHDVEYRISDSREQFNHFFDDIHQTEPESEFRLKVEAHIKKSVAHKLREFLIKLPKNPKYKISSNDQWEASIKNLSLDDLKNKEKTAQIVKSCLKRVDAENPSSVTSVSPSSPAIHTESQPAAKANEVRTKTQPPPAEQIADKVKTIIFLEDQWKNFRSSILGSAKVIKFGRMNELTQLQECRTPDKAGKGYYAKNAIDADALFKVANGSIEAVESDSPFLQSAEELEVNCERSEPPTKSVLRVYKIGKQWSAKPSLFAGVGDVKLKDGEFTGTTLDSITILGSGEFFIILDQGTELGKHGNGRPINLVYNGKGWSLEKQAPTKATAPPVSRPNQKELMTTLKGKIEDSKKSKSAQELVNFIKDNKDALLGIFGKDNFDGLKRTADILNEAYTDPVKSNKDEDKTKTEEAYTDLKNKIDSIKNSDADPKIPEATAEDFHDHPLFGGKSVDVSPEKATLYVRIPGESPAKGDIDKKQPILTMNLTFK